MKKSFTLFSFFLWSAANLYSQTNQFKTEIAPHNRSDGHTLTDVPLRPHSRKIDVFFSGEKPKQPYYKIKILDVTNGLITNYNMLLERLQEKAQLEGLDALMLLDVGRTPVYAGGAYVGHHIYNAQTMYAVGLKYPSNMQYVDTIVKRAEISIFHNGVEETLHQVGFDMNGYFSDTLMRLSNDYYLRNIGLFQKADYFTIRQPIGYTGLLLKHDKKWMATDSGEIRYKAFY